MRLPIEVISLYLGNLKFFITGIEMETIFYILIFCIGCLFGSFSTLAVYRIPLHQDITHKRSYCPNCNHKLSFFDMIPILSYVFLKGKCRYCKQKIRIRYLLLEISTGLVFLLFAISLNLSFYPLKISELILMTIYLLYFAGIIIIAGIDKEKMRIQKEVLLYEIIIVCIYMVYLCVIGKASIYRYIIYLICLSIFVIIDNTYLNRKKKSNYTIEILELSMIMVMITQEQVYVATVILTLLAIALEKIIRSLPLIKSKKDKTNKISFYNNVSMGFYLGVSNIISLIVINFINI